MTLIKRWFDGCRGSIQDHLDCVLSAIDSISCGDLVDVMVRRRQNWNLLPTQVHTNSFFCDLCA